MPRNAQSTTRRFVPTFTVAMLLVGGCSGGHRDAPAMAKDTEQSVGAYTTRVIGTAQAPVVSASQGAVVTGVAGATIDNLTELRDRPFEPVGQKLIVTRHINTVQGPEREIGVLNLDGTGLASIPLTRSPYTYLGSFSADASKLLFITGEPYHTEIAVYNVIENSVSKLTNSNTSLNNPKWIAGDSLIGYYAYSDAYRMNPDGSNQTPVVVSGGLAIRDSSWSPDGSYVAFIADPYDGKSNLYLLQTRTGSIQQLTFTNDASYFGGGWNRDGKRVVFNRNGPLYVLNAASASVQLLLPAPQGQTQFFSGWSPDGQRFLLTRYPTADDSTAEIWIANADGSGVMRLSPASAGDTAPTWSPDGTKIAFLHSSGGSYGIYTMNPDGSARKLVFKGDGTIDGVVWSPTFNFPNRKLVGAGGLLASSCAGFLAGQQGKRPTAVVTFDTAIANRAKVRVTALTPGSGSGAASAGLTFSVDAGDSLLTSLRFVNGNGNPVYVIGSNALVATATSAIVTFDATTGEVASVIPYNANRAAAVGPGQSFPGLKTN